MAALQQVAQASTGTPGRKNLVWVGNGFPSANLVGLEQSQADTIEAAMRHCTARLLAARITMYSINPTANSTSVVEVDTPDDLNTSMDENGSDPFGSGLVAFSNFAPSTGGVAFTGRNDLSNVIAEGVAKGQGYYTLSYSPTNISEDAAKFRRIRIVMKDPNLRATTRDGYYPETAADLNPVLDKSMSAKDVAANLKLDLSAALTTTISYNGLSGTATRSVDGSYTIKVEENGLGWSDPGPEPPNTAKLPSPPAGTTARTSSLVMSFASRPRPAEKATPAQVSHCHTVHSVSPALCPLQLWRSGNRGHPEHWNVEL